MPRVDFALITDELGETEHDPNRLRTFEEHGESWIECLDCGRQWRIVQYVSSRGVEYDAAEEISQGDGSCGENRAQG